MYSNTATTEIQELITCISNFALAHFVRFAIRFCV